MELSELKNRIVHSFSGATADLEAVLDCIDKDRSIFPFNEYEHLICNLIEHGGLTYQQYIEIRAEYIAANPNLWIFEISAPRGFGEKFAQTYVMAKCSKLKTPTKLLDPHYAGQYDLWLDGITIEVKASRAVDSTSDEPLYMKALARSTKKSFVMNFQQLKPQFCAVFIWVAVFRDEIVLWVMNSTEVANHPSYSKGQHRGNSGNEGQLHITHENIQSLSPYQLRGDHLEESIRNAAHRRDGASYAPFKFNIDDL